MPPAAGSPSTIGRLRSIDLLRGAAALAVVFYHAVGYADVPPNSPTALRAFVAVCSRGHLGVPLFFVISGFCIHLGWANRYRRTGQDSMQWFAFWRRRIKRLYPAYCGALVLAMSLVFAAYVYRPGQAIVTQYPQPRLGWMSLDFLSHLLMLHGLIPRFDSAGGNPAFWTLAREEYLYAMYAILLVFRRRLRISGTVLTVAGLGVAFQAVMFYLVHPTPGPVATTVYSSALSLWVQWCLGFVAAEAYVGNCKVPRIFTSLWMVPLFWTAATLANTYLPILEPTLWGVTFFTLLNAAVSAEAASRWPENWLTRWLAAVGVFSYSLYLVHVPARTLVKYALVYSGTKQGTPLTYFLDVVVIVIAGYFSGRIFFWLIEERCLSRPALSDTKAVAAAGA